MTKKNSYGIDRWGEGYFDVNAAGHVTVKPDRQGEGGDLFLLMQTLVEQGIEPPILIRFSGILRDRINTLCSAFNSAIQEYQYRSMHQLVFPLKVNPQKHVVDILQQAGAGRNIGMEVGSKPELVAILALETHPDALLLCNGYKDADYISLALMARKLGRRIIITIEQIYELKLVIDLSESFGIDAEIGFRMKLSNAGSGRWEKSGGEHSKFGLTAHEIMTCIEQLQLQKKAHWVKLLHFHLGSQVTSIDSFTKALKEGARMYTELAGLLPSMQFFDVGGGLAVDYDGSKSTSQSSMNYTIEEYARDVVYSIGQACLAAGIKDPVLITESGRALVSQHTVLITEVLDVTTYPPEVENKTVPSEHEILNIIDDLKNTLTINNCREYFHDLIDLKERILQEFIFGQLTLKERAYSEEQMHLLLERILCLFKEDSKHLEEIELLEAMLQETYFCNFSLFQSLPDSWAIEQLFPVMPIHRLNESAVHCAILADITCDSDGKIDRFINPEGIKNQLKLHTYQSEPYYLGIFMVGAYQEIIGGMHNLFGDTNVIQAELHNGEWDLSYLVEGDTIEEVLHYVQYNPENLFLQLQKLIEKSLKEKRITLAESAQIKKKFKDALNNYTYLVV